jgi:predicted dehydrogenase
MIRWGIIGCGDVTELKSGPAFNKVPNSALIAVMRRDAVKAKDYASRHNVPKWYSDAGQLLSDPDINAIYVATPPDTHEYYTLNAIAAGKPVYVEKPMALNVAASKRMAEVAREKNSKLSIAHYRREQPLFKKIKELIDNDAIGNIKYIDLKLLKPSLLPDELKIPKTKWRVDPSIAGGGLFHDLAPHQLDLMLYFFGDIKSFCGHSFNQDKEYLADDVVTGNMLFENGIVFNGLWCFTVAENEAADMVEIHGSKGKIQFGVFDNYNLSLTRHGKNEVITFERIQHVQQPMIEKVVEYFSGVAKNPCPPDAGVAVMEIMESFTKEHTS